MLVIWSLQAHEVCRTGKSMNFTSCRVHGRLDGSANGCTLAAVVVGLHVPTTEQATSECMQGVLSAGGGAGACDPPAGCSPRDAPVGHAAVHSAAQHQGVRGTPASQMLFLHSLMQPV